MLVVYAGFPTAIAAMATFERGPRASTRPRGAMSTAPVAVEPDFGAPGRRAAGPGVTVREVEVMPGGHSGLTHRVTLDGLPRARRRDRQVDAPGPQPRGRHDVLRQARIMRALAPVDGVPIPEVCFEDPRPSHRSSPRPACRARRSTRRSPRTTTTCRPTLVAARWQRATEVLAALHAVDPRRSASTASRRARRGEELELWCATMGAAADGRRSRVPSDCATRCAPASAAVGRAALVHGDFRLGNILFDGAYATR